MAPFETPDLNRLLAGDKAAWDAFVPWAAGIMKAVIRRALVRAGRERDVSDVLQEAFVRLLRDDCNLLRRFDPDRAQLSTWLGVIAASVAVDWLRKGLPVAVELSDAPDEALAVHDVHESERHLRLPPDLLSERQALILTLIYEDDMDVAEVAAMLRIEAQTVRSQRHKALARLRDFLRGGGDV